MLIIKVTMEHELTLTLNHVVKFAKWCRTCDKYEQVSNTNVVWHGVAKVELIERFYRINLFVLKDLINLPINEVFGKDYDIEDEFRKTGDLLRQVFNEMDERIVVQEHDIGKLVATNIDSIIDFLLQLTQSFPSIAERVRKHSSVKSLKLFDRITKSIVTSVEKNDINAVINILMDLNISGYAINMQFAGIFFNMVYVLLTKNCPPERPLEGITYHTNASHLVECITNTSMQSFFYKYKRRWLVYYKELLLTLKNDMDVEDAKSAQTLMQTTDLERIEELVYKTLVTQRQQQLVRDLPFIERRKTYPKTAEEVYNYWYGRKREQTLNVLNSLGPIIDTEQGPSLFPFLLSLDDTPKNRQFQELMYLFRMCAKSGRKGKNDEQVQSFFALVIDMLPTIYPEIYFPNKKMMEKMDMNIVSRQPMFNCATCSNDKQDVIVNINDFTTSPASFNTLVSKLLEKPDTIKAVCNYFMEELAEKYQNTPMMGQLDKAFKKMKTQVVKQ